MQPDREKRLIFSAQRKLILIYGEVCEIPDLTLNFLQTFKNTAENVCTHRLTQALLYSREALSFCPSQWSKTKNENENYTFFRKMWVNR
jgi:hypothetical protein